MSYFEKRTDLALEVRESFPEDDIEIQGVALRKEDFPEDGVSVTTVEIMDEAGAKQMKKPVGTYVTLEFAVQTYPEELVQKNMYCVAGYLQKILRKVMEPIFEKKRKREGQIFSGRKEVTSQAKPLFMVSGLGNRFATPDALGPFVLENLPVNRHFFHEFGTEAIDGDAVICGISPGVMSQTGMETGEILKGIIEKVRPDILIVVDALAAQSVSRLCRTIQITNTGIAPGAGVGNNRNEINESTMGVPVIAIGVPTVVDAGTIIYEALENALLKEGYREQEIGSLYQMIADEKAAELFVTPKDIDEEIRIVGKMVAMGVSALARV